MRRARVQAVCRSCRWREVCPDADALEQMSKAIESTRLTGEFPLRVARQFRLGCERYRFAGREPVADRTPLRLIVANDADPSSA